MIQVAHCGLKEAAVLHLMQREASLNQLFLHWLAVSEVLEEISDFVLLKHEEVAWRLSLLTQHVIY